MTDVRRCMLIGIALGAAVAMFSLATPFSSAAAMPTSDAAVHAAQAGLSQVENAQAIVGGGAWRGPGWRGPGWHRGLARRRVCFWRFGRRVCVWR
jgi:hypothetical protein